MHMIYRLVFISLNWQRYVHMCNTGLAKSQRPQGRSGGAQPTICAHGRCVCVGEEGPPGGVLVSQHFGPETVKVLKLKLAAVETHCY